MHDRTFGCHTKKPPGLSPSYQLRVNTGCTFAATVPSPGGTSWCSARTSVQRPPRTRSDAEAITRRSYQLGNSTPPLGTQHRLPPRLQLYRFRWRQREVVPRSVPYHAHARGARHVFAFGIGSGVSSASAPPRRRWLRLRPGPGPSLCSGPAGTGASDHAAGRSRAIL
jgi:hypothetical protein